MIDTILLYVLYYGGMAAMALVSLAILFVAGLEAWDGMSAKVREWVCGLTFGSGMTAATVYMFTL